MAQLRAAQGPRDAGRQAEAQCIAKECRHSLVVEWRCWAPMSCCRCLLGTPPPPPDPIPPTARAPQRCRIGTHVAPCARQPANHSSLLTEAQAAGNLLTPSRRPVRSASHLAPQGPRRCVRTASRPAAVPCDSGSEQGRPPPYALPRGLTASCDSRCPALLGRAGHRPACLPAVFAQYAGDYPATHNHGRDIRADAHACPQVTGPAHV